MTNQIVDARGLQCPMPLLKAKQALNKAEEGDVITVLATDAGSWKDFHAFARQSTHELLEASESNGEYTYQLKKGQLVIKQFSS